MADATFNDVLKEQQKTNEIIKQNAKDADKPNPKKFYLEEILAFRQNRIFHKENKKLDVERNKEDDKQTKISTKRGIKDTSYYKSQLKEQTATTDETMRLGDAQEEGDLNRQTILAESLSIQRFQSELLKGILLFQLGNQKTAAIAATKAQAKANLQQETEAGRFELLFLRLKDIFSLKNIGKALALPLKGVFKAAGFLGKKAKGLFGKLKDIFTGKTILALIAGLGLFFGGPLLKKLDKWIRSDGIPALAHFIEFTLPEIGNFFVNIGKGIKKYFTDNPDFQKAYKLIKKGEFFEAIKTGLLGVINDITEFFGGKRQDSLSKAVSTPLVNAYNAIAKSLNGIIDYIPGVPYIPVIKDGKFISGDPNTVEGDKFGKLSGDNFRTAVTLGTQSGSAGREQLKRFLDKNFDGTQEQRKNLENLIAREALGKKFDKALVGDDEGLAAINLARKRNIIDPARIKQLIKAFKTKGETAEDIATLEKNLAQTQREARLGAKKALRSRADPDSLFGVIREDMGQVLSDIQKNLVTLREKQAQQTNIINNIQPIDASSRSTSFGGGGQQLQAVNPSSNMVTDSR